MEVWGRARPPCGTMYPNPSPSPSPNPRPPCGTIYPNPNPSPNPDPNATPSQGVTPSASPPVSHDVASNLKVLGASVVGVLVVVVTTILQVVPNPSPNPNPNPNPATVPGGGPSARGPHGPCCGAAPRARRVRGGVGRIPLGP